MSFRNSIRQAADNERHRRGVEAKGEKFDSITLTDTTVSDSKSGEDGSVVGAHATVATSGQIAARVTATRLLATGVFALAAKKKKDRRQLFLTVEGESFAFVVDVDPKKEKQARQFAAKINSASRA